MKKFAPYIFLVAGIAILTVTLTGKDGYSKVKELRETLKTQEQINFALVKEIRNYKKEIIGINNDDRELEKTVRNEYAMGKKDETIVVFKKK